MGGWVGWGALCVGWWCQDRHACKRSSFCAPCFIRSLLHVADGRCWRDGDPVSLGCLLWKGHLQSLDILMESLDCWLERSSLWNICVSGSRICMALWSCVFLQRGSLNNVTLPRGLRSITVGFCFDQSLDVVTLPRGFQSIASGNHFDQSPDNVTLLGGQQILTFGDGSTSFWITWL